MKKVLVFIVLFTCFMSAFTIDELWNKTLEIAENSWQILPGRITMTSETSFSEGLRARTMRMEIVFGLSKAEDGTVRAFSISRDLTSSDEIAQRERNEINRMVDRSIRELLEQDFTPKREGIFTADCPNTTVRRQRNTRTIDGRLAQSYRVTHTPTGKRTDRIDGTVWIDAETRAPLLSEMRPSQFPEGVRRMDIKTFYKYLEDTNQFIVIRQETSSTAQGGNMIFTSEQVQVFEEHWALE